MTRTMRFIIGGILAAAVWIVLGIMAVSTINSAWAHIIKLEARVRALEAKAAASQLPAVTPSPLAALKEPSIAERFARATVRKREGIEHPLTRQLVADPTLISTPHLKDFKGVTLEKYTGDPKDLKALTQWAGRQAHLIAIGTGKVSLHFGAQIYVRVPDSVAYMIQKDLDGSLNVAEYVTTPGQDFGASPKPTNTRVVAANVLQAEFLGNPGGSQKIPAYEYLFAG